MAGLTTTGITIKDVDEIISDLESEQLATISSELQVTPDGVLGQLNGIYAAALAEVYELIEQVYQAGYADTASGQSLSYVAALSGVYRRAATSAEVTVNFFSTLDGQVYPSGTRLYTQGDADSLFETTESATCDVAAAPFGFLGTAKAVAVTPGAYASVPEAGTMVPESSLANFNTATGTSLEAGQDEETDSQLRFRREQTLARPGSATPDAMRAALLGVTGVDSATIFENTSGQTDSFGVPPHSFEALIYNQQAPTPDPDAIASTIWLNKPVGTQTHGDLSGTVTDENGVVQTVYYSEPTTELVLVAVSVQPDNSGQYLGNSAIEQAVVDWWASYYSVGQNAYKSELIAFVSSIQGVEYVETASTSLNLTTQVIAGPRDLLTCTLGGTVISNP